MNLYQDRLCFETSGRGFLDITKVIEEMVTKRHLARGICHLFLCHTSASLIICENASANVLRDLEKFTQRWVPDGDKIFSHDEEGIDDMPSHIRSIFTQSSLQIPIIDDKLGLGTWQGIFLWEHRFKAHTRNIILTITSD
jgi:secondary thiamine-phosphate synthase enzyme